jgi:amino acid transporter
MSNFKPVAKDEVPAAIFVGIVSTILTLVSLGLITTTWLSFVYLKDFQWWAAIATLVTVASSLLTSFCLATFWAFFRVDREYSPKGWQALMEAEIAKTLVPKEEAETD